METFDKVTKGLECHARPCGCDMGCPYVDECREDEGCPMSADALALIQQLQADNAEKDQKIQQLEAERDAAVACIPRVCKYCKHDGPLNAWGESECELDSVFPNGCLNGNTGWQWRGVQT